MLGKILAHDKLAHSVIGVVLLLELFFALSIFLKYGAGPAAAFHTTFIGIGLELYQRVRKEGQPDLLDAAATALSGFVFWAALSLP